MATCSLLVEWNRKWIDAVRELEIGLQRLRRGGIGDWGIGQWVGDGIDGNGKSVA